LALLEGSNLIKFLNSTTSQLPLPAHALEMADEGEVDKNAQEQMDVEEDGDVSELTAEGK